MTRADEIDSWDVDAWCRRAVELFPEIEGIALVGSRAHNYERTDSDWDIVVWFRDDCYDQNFLPLDEIESRLAFHPELRFFWIDLFFLRPDGFQGRWRGESGDAVWASYERDLPLDDDEESDDDDEEEGQGLVLYERGRGWISELQDLDFGSQGRF